MKSLFSLPVRRPVATSMVFAAIVLLGLIGWQQIPVELLPALTGDQLYVSFFRPGSEPEVVEREILLPLEARTSELPGVEETWGEVRGATGTFRVRFEPGTDLKVRELELQTVAADLARLQPEGTTIQVSAQDLAALSRFVMFIQITGGEDRNALADLVDERISPRIAAVTGVSSVFSGGGAPLEMTVRIDPDRCAALGVTPGQVAAALAASVRRLRFLGGAEDEAGRTAVILDGRPRGPISIGEIRVTPGRPVLVRHVADVEQGVGREEMLFRVNGRPSVGLVVFQEEAANLVTLGSELRQRLEELRLEFEPYGLEFVIGYDAADMIEEQMSRLKRLAASGFVIALAVLLLFLRQLRAVAVVAVAVPVSLLAAIALLYVGGLSLNLITLFGLAVGIGMLVDNSIVVYEAVQRQLERGADPDEAAAGGIRRTVRAIVAATATTAVVFLPVAFVTEEAMVRGLLETMAISILLPLAASLVVAIGLVPLLARRLAAPAAMARLAAVMKRRESLAGLVRPDRPRELFSGLLKVALRRPAGWLAGVAAAVLFTVVVALPWVAVSTATEEPPEADEVRLTVEVPPGGSLEATGEVFARLEQTVLELEGIRYVESVIQEQGGSLTVRLEDKDVRPEETSARRVRAVVRRAAEPFRGVEVRSAEGSGGDGGEGGGVGGLLGTGPAEVVLSGPDARALERLAEEIKQRLESIPEIGSGGAWVSSTPGQEELRVVPDLVALARFGLTPDQVLPALGVVRREGLQMRTGFTLPDGREIPLTIRSVETDFHRAGKEIEALRLATPAGVLPLGVLASAQTMPPPPTISHHNGRREVNVYYRLGGGAPKTGPARQELDEQIQAAVREVHRPIGFTVEARGEDEATGWFKRVLIPIVLLLFAVLAVTFESLTLPILVLVAVPLTILGATWALVLAGMPAGMMALVGAVALLGLTVNPAILLVDRMQQRVLRGCWTAGAAALAAVRERTRPVLMTTCTTIAGLWPLALVTGRENEIWPPFATVVMGGLATSTLLTLLVTPVGFVLLHRLDALFGRVGPWVILAWIGATTAVMAPLTLTGQITSLTWQIITTLLVAGFFLGAAVFLVRRPAPLEPDTTEWEARDRLVSLAVVLTGVGYLALAVQTMWWRLVFSFVAAALLARVLLQLRRWRGRVDALGRVAPGGPEGLLAALTPWIVLCALALRHWAVPRLADETVRLQPVALVLVAAVLLVVQQGRRTAVKLARGEIRDRLEEGRLRRTRTLWRRFSRRVLGLDLPRQEIEALRTVTFSVEGGMVGILGPNGAGKTTLLRLLAGILDPSLGVVALGGAPIQGIRRYLARWVGYLPQDFGLHNDLTAREYLDYYALLYDIGSESERRERVDGLLEEVGLGDRSDDRIGGYSGGMRQRVAVARTLLRLPPVIIVDEPTVGLDPRERIRFRNLLARLAEGRVVLFSTHVVEDVAVACDRVIVLAGGEIVFDGEPSLLALEARGWVWELVLAPGEVDALPEGAKIVDQVPLEDGSSRARVLCDVRPLATAREAEPTLEDGYLRLVGESRGGAR